MKLTHGHARGGSRSPTYIAWWNMRARCSNPKAHNYHRYGGRGITICARWYLFEHFLADMGERPAGLTLDRIDSNGDYSPSNCRWASMEVQENNRRNNHRLDFAGENLTLTQWAERTGIIRNTLWRRLNLGWPIERVLTEAVR